MQPKCAKSFKYVQPDLNIINPFVITCKDLP